MNASTLFNKGWEHFGEYTWRTAPNAAVQTISANTFTTLTLDTEVLDTGSKGSISANEVTLEAGTYEYDIEVPMATNTTDFASTLRLYNVSDSLLITSSLSSVFHTQKGATPQVFKGRFVLTAQKLVRLDIIVSNAADIGPDVVYTDSTAASQDRTKFQFKWKA